MIRYLRWLPLLCLLCSGLLLGLEQDANDTPLPEADTPLLTAQRAALIEVFGAIDQRQLRYVRRVLQEAKEADVDLIVTRIESPGGGLMEAIELLDLVIDTTRAEDGPRMIAWIDRNAYSAAAMLAYGHQEIWMRPGSIIGNIGIIFMGSDGEIRYGPEKIQSTVRAILRATSDLRDWDTALLVKMTSHNQELYEARFEDGRRVYVIEDDIGTFLADHPEIDPENRQQWAMIAGEDRLITFVAEEAVKRRMATGLVDDIDDLWAHLGVDPEQVLNLSPTPVELTARRLGMLAPIFAALAIIFLVLEAKTPGVGVFAILALCSGIIFLGLQYYQDLVGHWEIILIALGIVLLLVEVFTLVGGGLIGISGAALFLIGLFASFLPSDISWSFQDEGLWQALESGLANLGLVIVLCLVGSALAIYLTPRLPLIDRLSQHAQIRAGSGGSIEAEQKAAEDAGSIRQGLVIAECHPSGTVLIGERSCSARAEHGSFIPAGTQVVVLRAEFGELVVRPLDKEPTQAEGDTA